MTENIAEDAVLTAEDQESIMPEPGPTPEEEAEWERQREAAWEAKIKPYRDLKEQISEHDDLMAETLYEVTLLELGMEG